MFKPRPRGRLHGLTGRPYGTDDVERRLREVESQLGSHQERLQRQRQRLDDQRARLDHQRDRLEGFEVEVTELGVVYGRLEHQIAALEVRAADMATDRTELAATDTERAEARRLLDEVQDEHARIRARFQVVTRYEERVRRLEQALKPERDKA